MASKTNFAQVMQWIGLSGRALIVQTWKTLVFADLGTQSKQDVILGWIKWTCPL